VAITSASALHAGVRCSRHVTVSWCAAGGPSMAPVTGVQQYWKVGAVAGASSASAATFPR
jgi:hypothetical protein